MLGLGGWHWGCCCVRELALHLQTQYVDSLVDPIVDLPVFSTPVALMDPCYLIQLSHILQGFQLCDSHRKRGTLHDSINKVFVGLEFWDRSYSLLVFYCASGQAFRVACTTSIPPRNLAKVQALCTSGIAHCSTDSVLYFLRSTAALFRTSGIARYSTHHVVYF